MAEKHLVVVYLTNGGTIMGEPYEMDVDEVQKIVTNLIQAEGQGSFVVDCGLLGWACIPTRSILYIGIEPCLTIPIQQ